LHALAGRAKEDSKSALQLLFDCEFLGILRRRFVGLHSKEFGGDPANPQKMVQAFEPYQRYRIERLNGKLDALDRLKRELSALGIRVDELSHGEIHITDVSNDDDELKQKIEARLAFIREKNWAEADKIRDELLAQGIQLKDGKDPATGERITTWEVKR
jgi:cysteinyl-tRNA synthetase